MNLPMRVLLIEDDPEHADLIRSHISRRHAAEVEVLWANRLSAGLGKMESHEVDVILLDLGLPDSTMDTTLSRVLPVALGTPVVVLSSLEDEEYGIKAVHQGAQDYISKSWMDGELLFRSLRYAIERKLTVEELRKANRTKDEFLTTLSHELRTPIGVIQGFAEILGELEASEEVRTQALDAIRRNARLQISLINDMLDMSRIITGKLTLQSKVEDLSAIVVDAIEAVGLAARNKQIQISSAFDSTSASIFGDQVRLHQIMWNLLSNAVKFTPAGGRIDVRVRRTESQVEVEVADNGEGIDPTFLPYVFDRFRQQDGSIQRQHGGLGLGLAIVKHLAELHGGRTWVRTGGIGKGATFTVSFPSAQVHASVAQTVSLGLPSEDHPRMSTSVERSPRQLAGLNILAIDDSEDSLLLLQVLLRRNGAAVVTASSAAGAREALLQMVPDLIVCDIGMPEEDGYSFIRRLRTDENLKNVRHVPAIALTAYTREEEKRTALQAGFQVHLAKPFDERLLIRGIVGLTTLLA